jgi:hypothetical protein
MKMLMLHALDYELKPFERNLASADAEAAAISCRNAVVAMIHIEAVDEDSPDSVVTKAIKNIKWLARKVGSEVVALHSFAHLATSKADTKISEEIIRKMAARLAAGGRALLVGLAGSPRFRSLVAPGAIGVKLGDSLFQHYPHTVTAASRAHTFLAGGEIERHIPLVATAVANHLGRGRLLQLPHLAGDWCFLFLQRLARFFHFLRRHSGA